VARLVTWSQYRETIGDRSGLSAGLADRYPVERALYPGSCVDLSPSTAFRSVTYVDTDALAARSFADTDLVRTEPAGRTRPGAGAAVRFVAADYRHPLDVPDHSVDLLISLSTGPMWESARRYLRDGGWLLANTSHGDAALAALDRSLRLAAVVHHRGGRCRVSSDGLDDYLVPSDRRRPMPPGSAPRGAASPTKGAFAYLFQRA